MSNKHATAANFDGYLADVVRKMKASIGEFMMLNELDYSGNWHVTLYQNKQGQKGASLIGEGYAVLLNEAIVLAWHDAAGTEMPPL